MCLNQLLQITVLKEESQVFYLPESVPTTNVMQVPIEFKCQL